MANIEVRYTRVAKPSVTEGKLHGRAAAFNKTTQIGPDSSPHSFKEKIAPGAFKKSVSERDIVLLDSHNSEKPLARTSAGNLTLGEGADGLDWEANPPNTTYADDVRKNAIAGNYGGCSFGFEVVRDSWKRGRDGAMDERTLEEVKLHEISIVAFPAYGDGATSVSARDQIKAAQESRERALGPYESENAPDGEGDEMSERADSKSGGNKPYGNVTYADPKNGKYPVDTAEHAKAAWSYINMPKNASKYPLNGVSLASVKAKIKAALAKFGVKTSDEKSFDLDTAEMRELVLAIVDENTPADERMMYVDVIRGQDIEIDPYVDDFYETDPDAGDDGRSERDADDGDPVQGKNKNGSGKSDASDGDEGKAEKSCNECDGSGKDKSGNQCARCSGSGKMKHGDGKNHHQGDNGDKADGKNPGKNQQNSEDDSSKETRSAENGEPDTSTRTVEDRKIALRKMRSRMMREQIEAADGESK